MPRSPVRRRGHRRHRLSCRRGSSCRLRHRAAATGEQDVAQRVTVSRPAGPEGDARAARTAFGAEACAGPTAGTGGTCGGAASQAGAWSRAVGFAEWSAVTASAATGDALTAGALRDRSAVRAAYIDAARERGRALEQERDRVRSGHSYGVTRAEDRSVIESEDRDVRAASLCCEDTVAADRAHGQSVGVDRQVAPGKRAEGSKVVWIHRDGIYARSAKRETGDAVNEVSEI